MEKVENEAGKEGRAFERNADRNKSSGSRDTPVPGIDIGAQALEARTSDFSIHPIFLRRWSPRALLPVPVALTDLNTLFEAARWAPSTYNEQEWRFLYAQRDSAEWELFFDALTDQNRVWCVNAGTLVCICGKNELTKSAKVNPVRSFDCGAAFQNMALQAGEMGMIVHGMAGFSPEIARKNLQVPIEFSIEAMVAIGYPGNPAELDESLQKGEKPSGRKPLSQVVCQGTFLFNR